MMYAVAALDDWLANRLLAAIPPGCEFFNQALLNLPVQDSFERKYSI
jgi:hypothetical protein